MIRSNGMSAFLATLAQSALGLLEMPLDLITGFSTAPGAGPTAVTLGAGDSLQVRNAPGAKDIRLLTMWGQNQVAGFMRVRSANFSDNVQGIRAFLTTANPSPRTPLGWSEPMVMLDNLIIENGGSAVGGQIESVGVLMYYDNVPNMGQGYIDDQAVLAKAVKTVTVRTVNAAGAGGGYTGQVAINSTDDNAKNGKYYAVLGYHVSAVCCSVSIRGVDTGNLRQAGPGTVALPDLTSNWFMRLSRVFKRPCVPVINWANKAGTFVDVVQDQGAASVTVQWYLAELAQ
jgi:hypothetical protein